MSKHEQFIATIVVEAFYESKREAEEAMDFMDREVARVISDGSVLPENVAEYTNYGELRRRCNYCGQMTEADFVECCDGSTSLGESTE
jgi:uncharacterized protein YfcZ (UPF0381/DUF406 family)